jgi:hypothetical protein
MFIRIEDPEQSDKSTGYVLRFNNLPERPPVIVSDLLFATLFAKSDAVFIVQSKIKV